MGNYFFHLRHGVFCRIKYYFYLNKVYKGVIIMKKIPSFVFAIALLIACASVNLSDSSNNGALPHCDEPYAVTSQ